MILLQSKKGIVVAIIWMERRSAGGNAVVEYTYYYSYLISIDR